MQNVHIALAGRLFMGLHGEYVHVQKSGNIEAPFGLGKLCEHLQCRLLII